MLRKGLDDTLPGTGAGATATKNWAHFLNY